MTTRKCSASNTWSITGAGKGSTPKALAPAQQKNAQKKKEKKIQALKWNSSGRAFLTQFLMPEGEKMVFLKKRCPEILNEIHEGLFSIELCKRGKRPTQHWPNKKAQRWNSHLCQGSVPGLHGIPKAPRRAWQQLATDFVHHRENCNLLVDDY